MISKTNLLILEDISNMCSSVMTNNICIKKNIKIASNKSGINILKYLSRNPEEGEALFDIPLLGELFDDNMKLLAYIITLIEKLKIK